MKKRLPLLVLSLAAAAALAACGGGDGISDREPTESGRATNVTVSSATQANLNGLYADDNTLLTTVIKDDPFGEERETCAFFFSDVPQTPGGRLMDGDIRYIPGSDALHVAFISIAGAEFRLQGTTGASVDRANDQIDFNGAVLTSTQDNSGNTITLTGSIPMRDPRPEGC